VYRCGTTLETVRRGPVPFVIVAAVALIGLLVYGVIAVGESQTLDDAVKRGDRPQAPSRVLPKLGGGEGSIAALKGRPLVVNFWASWCDPCKEEAPALRRAQAELEKAGGTVLGVTVDDSSPDSQAFIREFGLDFPSLRDVDGELGEDFGRTGVPETYVIDRDGRVVAISRGQVDDAFFDQTLPKVAQ
jgi:cytochrome c biogenesis protein CcmG, thiol:disulfide interchange protein DsbE